MKSFAETFVLAPGADAMKTACEQMMAMPVARLEAFMRETGVRRPTAGMSKHDMVEQLKMEYLACVARNAPLPGATSTSQMAQRVQSADDAPRSEGASSTSPRGTLRSQTSFSGLRRGFWGKSKFAV